MPLAVITSQDSPGADQNSEEHALEGEDDSQLVVFTPDSEQDLEVGRDPEGDAPKGHQDIQVAVVSPQAITSTYESCQFLNLRNHGSQLITLAATLSTAPETPTLTTLPCEVLANILPYLFDRGDALAFGLSHCKLYDILKAYQPRVLRNNFTPQVRDMAPEEPPDDWMAFFLLEEARTQRILTIIGDFIGPNYRRTLHHPIRTPYLNRSIYGDECGIKEGKLAERWTLHMLPGCDYTSPFGVGEAWYATPYTNL